MPWKLYYLRVFSWHEFLCLHSPWSPNRPHLMTSFCLSYSTLDCGNVNLRKLFPRYQLKSLILNLQICHYSYLKFYFMPQIGTTIVVVTCCWVHTLAFWYVQMAIRHYVKVIWEDLADCVRIMCTLRCWYYFSTYL